MNSIIRADQVRPGDYLLDPMLGWVRDVIPSTRSKVPGVIIQGRVAWESVTLPVAEKVTVRDV